MITSALQARSKAAAAAWMAVAIAIGIGLWSAFPPDKAGSRWKGPDGSTWSWDNPPQNVRQAGPAEVYTTITAHLASCALASHTMPDGSNGKVLRDKEYVNNNCGQELPEPSATNFFNLSSLSNSDARTVIVQYLLGKIYRREQPNNYVVSFIDQSSDLELKPALEGFYKQEARLADPRGNQSWNYYVGFWLNPFRAPDFASIDNTFGIDPKGLLNAVNVPIPYIVVLFFLPFTLLTSKTHFERFGQFGVRGLLDRRIATIWKASGYEDTLAPVRSYSRKHFLISLSIMLMSYIFLTEIFHQSIAFLLPVMLISRLIPVLYLKLSEYNWTWLHSIKAPERFRPIDKPAPAPAGEHGTASLQNTSLPTSTGFVDD